MASEVATLVQKYSAVGFALSVADTREVEKLSEVCTAFFQPKARDFVAAANIIELDVAIEELRSATSGILGFEPVPFGFIV